MMQPNSSGLVLALLATILPLLRANDNDDSSVCTADNSESCIDTETEINNKHTKQQKIFHCEDANENCEFWSKTDDGCKTNSAYMTQHCPVSCRTCEVTYRGHRLSQMLDGGLSVTPLCQDENFNCRQFAEEGECVKNPKYMNIFCEASCGVCSVDGNNFGVKQKLHKEDAIKEQLIKEQLGKSADYMYSVNRNRKYKRVRQNCLNMHQDCSLWAAQGECDKNEQYMKTMCAPACISCDYLGDTSEECTGINPNSEPLWKPGDLNAFFEEIVDNENGSGNHYQQFHPRALSRPSTKSNGKRVPKVEQDGPWLVMLDSFLTEEEADILIEIGQEQGFGRSVKAVTAGEGKITESRTSSNTWCKDSCMEDPTVARVLQRIANTTKSTVNHSEHLQLLKYSIGQFYVGHVDFIPYQLDYPCGARIMTMFLYLNDEGLKGGGTRFSKLGPGIDITVQPKKGNALLWPNVKNEDPMERDERTYHEALQVVKGVKFGANAWIHSEDFQTPWKLNCLG